jgi:hypothetical protein
MAIVETKISIRPNTSVPRISRIKYPGYHDVIQQRTESLFGPETVVLEEGDEISMHRIVSFANGQIVFEGGYDETGLIFTRTGSFANLQLWSQVDTILDVDTESVYQTYAQDNGWTAPASGQYSLTGIDAPFTCTTTYTYNPATIGTGYPLFESFVNVIESSDKLTAFTNSGTQLIAVHTYDDSADFTENHWRDFQFAKNLNTGGVTRTIAYAMV